MANSSSWQARLMGAGSKRISLVPLAITFVVVVCISLLATQLWMLLRARDVQLPPAGHPVLAKTVEQYAAYQSWKHEIAIPPYADRHRAI